MKSKIFILLTSILFLLLVSCSKDQGPFFKQVPIDPTDSVKFATQIQPIFNTYCISCHNETHPKLNLKSCCSYDELLFSGYSASYVDTANPSYSHLYRYLTGAPIMMPPSGKIPQPEIDMVFLWIKQGAVKN